MTTKAWNRRAFLRGSVLASVASTAGLLALQLAAMSEAAAQTANDYKALVCIFLFGGNDGINTVVPYDIAQYNRYAARRLTLAHSREALLPLNPVVALPGGLRMALAPSLGGLKNLFDIGKLGVLLNIGPLIRPNVTPTDVQNRIGLPPKLFSHNDQQSMWQSSDAEGAATGWGGRMGDRMMGLNNPSTFTCINTTGNAVFLSGSTAMPYSVGPGGAQVLVSETTNTYGSRGVSAAMHTLLKRAPATHWFEAEHALTMQRAIENGPSFNTSITAIAPNTPFDSDNRLAQQLKTVVQTIAARSSLGARRQVFFVGMGGFDTHDDQAERHDALLSTLSSALSSFYQATVEFNVAPMVTTFTASDFGRTLAFNGSGTDHGWGSHHFILGGAVRGKNFYGSAPVLSGSGASVGYGA